jgi:hypothetical protein
VILRVGVCGLGSCWWRIGLLLRRRRSVPRLITVGPQSGRATAVAVAERRRSGIRIGMHYRNMAADRSSVRASDRRRKCGVLVLRRWFLLLLVALLLILGHFLGRCCVGMGKSWVLSWVVVLRAAGGRKCGTAKSCGMRGLGWGRRRRSWANFEVVGSFGYA